MKDMILTTHPTILVGHGPVKVEAIRNLPNNWPIFAADGGANHLQQHRIRCQAIGDLDSCLHQPKNFLAWQPQPPQHFHHPDQDTNDLTKCLNQISAPLIIGFGFLDGQIDHTLATCHSVCLPHANPVILLHGKHDLVLYHRTPLTLELPLNTRFSIFPLAPQTFVRSSGLAYPLDQLTLSPSGMIGTLTTPPLQLLIWCLMVMLSLSASYPLTALTQTS